MKKVKIVLIGNYGAGNLGDELLCLGAQKIINDSFKDPIDYELTILRAERTELDPLVSKDMHVEALPLLPTGVNSLFRGLWSGSMKKSLKALKGADLVIFGGGGLLNAEVSRSIWIWGLQIYVTSLISSAKIILLGNSLAKGKPYLNKILGGLLQKCTLISLRDAESCDVARELVLNTHSTIIKQNTDLAFAVDLPQSDFATDDYLLFSLREYKAVDSQALLTLVSKVSTYVLENTDYKIKFLAMEEADCSIIQSFLENTQNQRLILVSPANISELVKEIDGAKAVIAMRLHAYIMAFLRSKPTLVLSYANKVMAMSKRLEVEPCLIDLRSELGNISEAELISRMQCMLKRVGITNTKSVIDKQRKVASDNSEYIKGIMKKTPTD